MNLKEETQRLQSTELMDIVGEKPKDI